MAEGWGQPKSVKGKSKFVRDILTVGAKFSPSHGMKLVLSVLIAEIGMQPTENHFVYFRNGRYPVPELKSWGSQCRGS